MSLYAGDEYADTDPDLDSLIWGEEEETDFYNDAHTGTYDRGDRVHDDIV